MAIDTNLREVDMTRAKPISALIMTVFEDEYSTSQGIITVLNDVLRIEKRHSDESWLRLTKKQLLQIIAFAVDNGMEFPIGEQIDS